MKSHSNQQISKMLGSQDLVADDEFIKIKKIIQQSKELKMDNWDKNPIIKFAVRDAILAGDVKKVRFFLQEGIRPDSEVTEMIQSRYQYELPLIYYAAKSGYLPMVKLLIEEFHVKIKPHWPCYRNEDSGILAAVIAGHSDIVDYLVKNGANVNGLCGRFNDSRFGYSVMRDCRFGDTTFLAKAAQDANYRIIETLLKNKASIQEALELASRKFTYEHNRCTSTLAKETNESERIKLQLEGEQLEKLYHQLVKNILDYAVGFDLMPTSKINPDHGLGFLRKLNIAGFNFIGISIGGQPITRKMLLELELKGAEHAIVELEDLKRVPEERRKALINRIDQVNVKIPPINKSGEDVELNINSSQLIRKKC